MYADIKGFTAYSDKHKDNPRKVVMMLSQLFTQFDKETVQFNVYKVCTIGDCYVVMGCTDATKRNPPEELQNVVKMAQQMSHIIKRVRK